MNILVVGSGGREHALCWAIAASPVCRKLYCAPGNAGIAEDAECVPIPVEDIAGLVSFAAENEIDFVVVGPEAPLADGLVDRLTEAGIKSFGPSAAAARLESSKGFMKDICAKYDVPTAAYQRFTDATAAKAYIREQGAPIVVKADGLAAGKGVTVAMSVDEACAAVDAAMVDGAFGGAGEEVVVEEFMDGEELSFFALCDGKTALPMGSAQDHKPVGDGDTGPNTGGMGAYSPAPVATPGLEAEIMDRIVKPTLAGMEAEGAPYRGVLFVGLMIADKGPRVVEFNVRFGDPECQVILYRMMSDILPALVATADGMLSSFDLRWYEEAAVSVVMASKGYPGSYEKGTPIASLGPNEDDETFIFHAGTSRDDAGGLIATGGRVLNVTARGETVTEAQTRAYAAVDWIDWPNGFCRRDIGWRAVERESA